MSLLRLPTLDRPSLGLSKRFSHLSTNTTASSTNDSSSSLTSLQALPSFERLDSDDFLNMFETQSDRSLEGTTPRTQPSIPELSATPRTSRFPELHGQPIHRPRPPPMSLSQSTVYPQASMDADQAQVDYRSSISSSNPSTKNSNASSRRARKSSASSMTEEYSASDYSSKESDRENALHERLKRRSKQRSGEAVRASSRFSGRTIQPRFQSHSEPRLSPAIVVKSHRRRSGDPQELDHASISTTHPVRPDSRGGRLGRAMADGCATSPQTSPRPASFDSHTRILSGQQQFKSPTGSRNTSAGSASSKRTSKIFPTPKVDGVDRIRVGIMCQLENLTDLQSCSQTSRDFWQTFQKYETMLVDHVLYQQSPAAWELRHSVRHLEKPSPFRFRSVQRDMSTIAALEDFIVWRCQPILRPETLNALLGETSRRKAELEEALWMIWTFCNLFGKTSMSDATFLKQTQWLNGGVSRTSSASSRETTRHAAATIKELEDMSEMWRCLEMLLSRFKGREEEARRIGLFDNVGEVKATDAELLNAWINDVLSLGPKAVLTLSSCDFEQAKVLGVTRWAPPAKGKSRSNFLKAAVEDVYRERLMREVRRKAADIRKNMKDAHKRTRSDPAVAEPGWPSHRQISPAESNHLKLDTRQVVRQSMPPQGLPSQQQERIEIRPDCDPLSSTPTYPAPILAPSMNSMVFSPLAMTKNASAKFGANLFPMQNRDQSKRYSIPLTSMITKQEIMPDPDVVDPVDRAIALLVDDMDFSLAKAKRALAMSDTGSGINVQKAIELLSADAQLPVIAKPKQICELPAAFGDAKFAPKPNTREYCEGTCKPLMLVEPKKARVTGLGIVKRGMSYRLSFRKGNRLSVILDDEEAGMSNTTPANTSRPHSGLPTVIEPASSTLDTVAPSSMPNDVPAPVTEEYACTGALPSPVSPVTPVTPPIQDWLRPDTNPLSDAEAYLNNLPVKPRVMLTRVGTGVNKTRWSLLGNKRKEQIIKPEVIGFAY